VISPHLDDAVLSCWHVLERGDATVATVFTASPEPGTSGWWDRLTGASDSVVRMEERRREDAAAMSLAGARAVGLGLLDEQYRPNGSVPALAAALDDATGEAEVVYVPLGIFLSADHGLVRDAALELDRQLRFYADHPHIGVFGLPSWLTGVDRGGLDVDGAWREAMRAAGLDPDSLTAEAHPLDDASFERKLEAVRAYATQVEALVCEAPLEQLRWEVTWTR
jgi:hypothetical protein